MPAAPASLSTAHDRLLALGFVTLYGAGFVGARLGLPHAEPFAFLALRFALAAGILAAVALAIGQAWPQGRRQVLPIIGAGLLTVGVFSAGVFYSIAGGLPPALSALMGRPAACRSLWWISPNGSMQKGSKSQAMQAKKNIASLNIC